MGEQNPIQAIRGTKDVLPADARYFQMLESAARGLFELYGYREIRTPILEATELFSRSSGDASDVIVSKQMYTFTDPGEHSNTMRPEGTAGVVRALVEAGTLKETSQQKLYYIGPMFRYERPQKGRLRQFTQIGIEYFGVAHPAADVEIITLCDTLLRRAGFENIRTKINTIGCRDCRKAYNEKLREMVLSASGAVALHGAESGGDATTTAESVSTDGGWCDQCVKRAQINPMRIFDCKVAECRVLAAELPKISEHVCEDCRAHFDQTLSLLNSAGVPYEIDPDLVRGFDYYSRTVFEIVQEGLGAQNAVLGGGRYDYLVEELGGPPTPGVGMSIGVERLIIAMEANGIKPPPERKCEYYILALDEAAMSTAMRLVRLGRNSGLVVAFDCQPKSARAGMKSANRSGATVALIVGEDELSRNAAQWKNLESGEQMELALEEIERNLISG